MLHALFWHFRAQILIFLYIIDLLFTIFCSLCICFSSISVPAFFHQNVSNATNFIKKHLNMLYITETEISSSFHVRCLFSLGWPPIQWLYHNKNTLWGSCFIMQTSFTPHHFLLGWLKLNPTLLLEQMRLAQGDECWWWLWLVLMLILFWLSQTWPVTLRIQG